MKKLCTFLTAIILCISFAFVFAACFGDSFDPTELQNELNELKGKYGELQTKHDGLQTKHDALQTELNTAKTELNAAIADKQSKIDALQSDLTAKQTQINKLLADGTAAQEDIDALQSDLDDALADIDALQSELDALHRTVYPLLYLTYGVGNWDGGNATYNASNKVREGINYVELGEYPCTYVGDGMNTTLNDAYNNGTPTNGMTATGKAYTSNSNTSTSATPLYNPKISPEYLYNGQKYVRVSILSFSATYPFSTGTNNGASGSIRWFKVEPIKWLIGNWDALPESINPTGTGTADAMNLVSAELVTGCIPFGASGVTLWSDSVARTFLNETFLSEAFDAATRGKIASVTVPNNTTAGTVNTVGDGVATTDKVYFPSYYEVFNANGTYNKVFDTNAKRQGVLTDFAIANYAYMGSTSNTSSYYRMGFWWLRSAYSSSYVRYVYNDGIDFYATPYILGNGVRPACALALS